MLRCAAVAWLCNRERGKKTTHPVSLKGVKIPQRTTQSDRSDGIRSEAGKTDARSNFLHENTQVLWSESEDLELDETPFQVWRPGYGSF